MMDAQLTELAAQIARQEAYQYWAFWIVLAALLIVGVFISAFLYRYADKVADIKAQTDKLPEIKAQLAEQTRTTEEIKADIGQKDWRERERIVVMRSKLEATFVAGFELHEAVDRLRQTMMDEHPLDEVDTSANRLEMLTTLYFPTLRAVAAALRLAAIESANSARSLHHAFRLYVVTHAVDRNSAETATTFAEFEQVKASHFMQADERLRGLKAALMNFSDAAAAEMPKYAP